ncbi:MAG: alpha/beta hydrolase [Archangiaceae bacterium]|nr:alpha/beta hydrolase [Archangiaceae bacterium]
MSQFLTLAVDDGGGGAALPLVFLHSAGGNASQFEAQLKHFRRTRRALAFDLRGHGRSAGGRSDDLAQHAADVLGSLDQLGLRRVALCGHSWGSAVALEAAAREPSRFAGVFFIDPASDGRAIPRAEADGLLAALAADYEATVTAYWRSLLAGARPDDAGRILEALLTCAPEVVIGTLACTLRWDPVSRLDALTMPRHALITPFNDVPSAWHRLVPSLPHSRIEHTSHWPHVDAPDEVNERLERFFDPLR